MNLENDDELLEYASIHCRTDLALFHCDHVRRLCAMAGWKAPWRIQGSTNGFFEVDAETFAKLLEDIEARKM